MMTSITPEQAQFISGYQASHTRGQSLDALGNAGKSKRDTEVFDIVVAAARNGVADLSGREIQQKYEFVTGKRIDTSTISGCVNRLIAAKRLQRGPERACLVTGRNIVPVRPVVQQVRLVG